MKKKTEVGLRRLQGAGGDMLGLGRLVPSAMSGAGKNTEINLDGQDGASLEDQAAPFSFLMLGFFEGLIIGFST